MMIKRTISVVLCIMIFMSMTLSVNANFVENDFVKNDENNDENSKVLESEETKGSEKAKSKKVVEDQIEKSSEINTGEMNTGEMNKKTSKDSKEILVSTEEELKDALKTDVSDLTIIIKKSFDLTERINVNRDNLSNNIIIRAEEGKEVKWDEDGNYVSGIKLTSSNAAQILIGLYTGNIEIKNIGIDGSEKSALVAQLTGNEDTNTNLDGVLLINGNRNLDGAGFRTGYNADIKNSMFKNNKGRYGGGIALLKNDATLNIENTKFIDNKTGAIDASNGGNLNIKKSEFRGNDSDFGSAIYAVNINSIIKDCLFINNKSSDNGGAIFTEKGKMTIVDSTFKGNEADGYGGSIMGYNQGKLDILSSRFIGNKSHNDGAISLNKGMELTIKDNSIFEDNIATNTGGAIGSYNNSNVSIENTDFNRNESKSSAGGGVFYINGSNLDIKNSNFKNNKADIAGAVDFISNQDNKLTIVNSIFKENLVTSRGGAISIVNNPVVNIEGSEFINNLAAREGSITNGGAITFSAYDGDASIKDSKFTGNQATNGGAIDIESGKDDSKPSKMNLENNIFEKNKGFRSGGAIYTGTNQHEDRGNVELTLLNNIFNDNSSVEGGAIYTGGEVVLNITGGEFNSNTSDNSGGAIWVQRSGSRKTQVVNISTTSFKENTSKRYGGALYLTEDGTVNIKNSSFIGNKAESGGAITANNFRKYVSAGSLNIETTEFKSNKLINKGPLTSISLEGNRGGAIYVKGYVGEFKDLRMIENETASDEKGLYGRGGAIYIANNGDLESTHKSNIVIDGGLYEGNQAKYGGAIGTGVNNNYPIEKLTIKNKAEFKNNRAERVGGFLYAYEHGRNVETLDSILKEHIFIDDTIKLSGNRGDERRYIDGFRGKFEKYEGDLTKNIKVKTKSASDTAFNNHDINMLGYEFLLIHENNKKNLVDVEVYDRKDDVIGLFKEGMEFVEEIEEGNNLVKRHLKLENWDLNKTILEGFNIVEKSEKNILDNQFTIDYGDIILTGNWKELDMETIQIKEDYKIIYKTVDGKVLEELKGSEKVGTELIGSRKTFDGYIFKSVSPSEGKLIIEKGKENIIEFIYEEVEVIEKPEKPEEPEKPGIEIPILPPVEKPGKPEIEDVLNLKNHFAYMEGYEDETIRPGDNISREEVSAIFFRLLNPEYREEIRSNTNSFNDVKKDRWSNKHISTLANGKILEGYPVGDFRPRNNITRAEIATIVSRFDNLSNKIINTKFNDIENHWARDYILSVEEKGWIEGYPDGSFRPDANMTRAEFVTLVNKMLKRSVKKENILDNHLVFKDLKETSWYYEAMQEAINSHDYEEDRLEDGSEIWIELTSPEIEM